MKMKRAIEPIVKIVDRENEKDDLRYWLSRTPEERIDAVLHLRKQYIRSLGYSEIPGIEPFVKIIPR
ncbi:MAG TPA: hypothetical protein PK573_16330 [Spirochaetota bacterium]|nr:hypothetical protein [Spirochaetota bacterium]HRZ26544.1 hypothetical protein [Spirochaetota bacterium]HSA16287.1 hypothetical protein [Spirochaetota bacterium]